MIANKRYQERNLKIIKLNALPKSKSFAEVAVRVFLKLILISMKKIVKKSQQFARSASCQQLKRMKKYTLLLLAFFLRTFNCLNKRFFNKSLNNSNNIKIHKAKRVIQQAEEFHKLSSKHLNKIRIKLQVIINQMTQVKKT
ncbi:hypothetical protein TTHERM_000309968 (macronuclear) [Tetrahymena thermophila SB210]|uniref:Uncharacterized protein n=1 Tax=Tetrahymena thermophila (strain SB210) TaxID=312017 RepID=W7XGA5_TETTS|nr:hypothetical protein TTHERM_000309968 [Tetrahymena thermophila SB210]EWS73136.1 hypothetical protein TTHERM_000309968 [Tetrahymena thermophila SB210]|eukprot:XP_012654323.1 hypothetical protein TTHERM_000309968 [Tetrahymena thermophila SB210]